MTLQWRHNERDGVSNHQPHDCLCSRILKCRLKEASKLCVNGFVPAQMASNAENVSIWWRHHAFWDMQVPGLGSINFFQSNSIPIQVGFRIIQFNSIQIQIGLRIFQFNSNSIHFLSIQIQFSSIFMHRNKQINRPQKDHNKSRINNLQVSIGSGAGLMAWCRSGSKPLPEKMIHSIHVAHGADELMC